LAASEWTAFEFWWGNIGEGARPDDRDH
jgi:hypothetical protein